MQPFLFQLHPNPFAPINKAFIDHDVFLQVVVPLMQMEVGFMHITFVPRPSLTLSVFVHLEDGVVDCDQHTARGRQLLQQDV